MKGSIRKRGKDSWEINVDLGRDATGHRLRKFVNVKGKKSVAEKKLRDLLTKMDQGLPVQADKLTVSEWAEMWLRDHIEPARRQKTTERYRDVVKKHILPYIGHMAIQKIGPSDIKTLEADWLSQGMSKQGVVYSHRILNACLKYGVRMEVIFRNPAEVIEPPKIERKEITPPAPSKVKAILEKAEALKESLFPALWLIAYTGMRRGECLGLEWGNVDLAGQKISIVQSLVRSSEKGLLLQPPKTRASRRVIDIDSQTVEILNAHRLSQTESKFMLGSTYRDKGLLFPNELGEFLNPMALTRTLDKVNNALGISKIRLHDLRHFHASILIQEGSSPVMISQRLGHSSPSMTLDTYGHLMPGWQREAAESFAGAMRRIS